MSRTNVSPIIKAQLEKLTAGGIDISSGLRPVSSSPPIIIPKKPPRSNTSSQSSSLCTSLADQMSASCETLSQLHQEADNASNNLSISLHPSSQYLGHSAARDRIAVKSKRQQPLRKKLSMLKESDGNQVDLFSNNFDDEEDFFPLKSESKILSQSVIDLSQLQKAQSRLRITPRPRDRSVDNILTSTSTAPTYSPSIARTVNFKRQQETKQTADNNQSLLKTNKDEEEQETQKEIEQKENKHETVLQDINANESNKTPVLTSSSSKEHIYDNFYIFNRHKINIIPDTESNENDSSANSIVQTRGRPLSALNRQRPVTMLPFTNNDRQKTNEFENMFNQIRLGQNKKVIHKEETLPFVSSVEPVQPPVLSIAQEKPIPVLTIENEPKIQIDAPTSMNKPVETPSKVQVSHLKRPPPSGSSSIIKDNNQPKPSWVDLAKQKQSKFPTALIENVPHVQLEQKREPSPRVEATMTSTKHIVLSSNEPKITKEAPSDDTESIKKPLADSSILRRTSTRRAPPATNSLERESIRALKANNPNRINNLIQLFNK